MEKEAFFPFPSRRFISLATEVFLFLEKNRRKRKTNRRKKLFSTSFLFFFLFFFFFNQLTGLISSVIMKAAVRRGDARKLAELMRQDPGFNVNMAVDVHGWTLLHFACSEESSSAMIPLLLAHPDIEVNEKNKGGWAPFYFACENGYTSCVREMLKDSRVKVNEPINRGSTPLYCAAANGCLDVIKWYIAWKRDGSGETRGCLQDGCHWRGKEERRDRSGGPAGEIQE